jgi:hypothetical protein
MKQSKDGRRAKDLKRKKLSVTQQEAVKGGIADGTSNTIMFADVVTVPAVQLRRTSKAPILP